MPDVKEQVNQVELALTERDLLFEHIDDYENPMISLSFGGGDFSFTQITINLIFDLDGESAQIVTSPIASIAAERVPDVLLALNDFNCKYRWTKLYLDEDDDIMADCDVMFDDQNCADVCIDMVLRTVNIIDEAYNDIMSAVWS